MTCDIQYWSALTSIFGGFATVGLLFVAYFQLSKLSDQMGLLKTQVSDTHEWNRRKSSQEIMNNLVFGEFPKLRNDIENILHCNIPDQHQTYDTKIVGISNDDKLRLDAALRQLLNVLECIAINVKHKIIDEDICYDYLGWIMSEYYRWSIGFINARRSAGNQRALAVFEEYGLKWSERIKSENQKMVEAGKVAAKAGLYTN